MQYNNTYTLRGNYLETDFLEWLDAELKNRKFAFFNKKFTGVGFTTGILKHPELLSFDHICVVQPYKKGASGKAIDFPDVSAFYENSIREKRFISILKDGVSKTTITTVASLEKNLSEICNAKILFVFDEYDTVVKMATYTPASDRVFTLVTRYCKNATILAVTGTPLTENTFLEKHNTHYLGLEREITGFRDVICYKNLNYFNKKLKQDIEADKRVFVVNQCAGFLARLLQDYEGAKTFATIIGHGIERKLASQILINTADSAKADIVLASAAGLNSYDLRGIDSVFILNNTTSRYLTANEVIQAIGRDRDYKAILHYYDKKDKVENLGAFEKNDLLEIEKAETECNWLHRKKYKGTKKMQYNKLQQNFKDKLLGTIHKVSRMKYDAYKSFDTFYECSGYLEQRGFRLVINKFTEKNNCLKKRQPKRDSEIKKVDEIIELVYQNKLEKGGVNKDEFDVLADDFLTGDLDYFKRALKHFYRFDIAKVLHIDTESEAFKKLTELSKEHIDPKHQELLKCKKRVELLEKLIEAIKDGRFDKAVDVSIYKETVLKHLRQTTALQFPGDYKWHIPGDTYNGLLAEEQSNKRGIAALTTIKNKKGGKDKKVIIFGVSENEFKDPTKTKPQEQRFWEFLKESKKIGILRLCLSIINQSAINFTTTGFRDYTDFTANSEETIDYIVKEIYGMRLLTPDISACHPRLLFYILGLKFDKAKHYGLNSELKLSWQILINGLCSDTKGQRFYNTFAHATDSNLYYKKILKGCTTHEQKVLLNYFKGIKPHTVRKLKPGFEDVERFFLKKLIDTKRGEAAEIFQKVEKALIHQTRSSLNSDASKQFWCRFRRHDSLCFVVDIDFDDSLLWNLEYLTLSDCLMEGKHTDSSYIFKPFIKNRQKALDRRRTFHECIQKLFSEEGALQRLKK